MQERDKNLIVSISKDQYPTKETRNKDKEMVKEREKILVLTDRQYIHQRKAKSTEHHIK
jgi:hypothetical protein